MHSYMQYVQIYAVFSCLLNHHMASKINGSKSYSHVRSTSPLIMIFWFSFFLFFCFFLFSPSTETSEEPLVDLSDVLNTDADILGMLGKPSSDSGASYISQAVTVARIYKQSPSRGLTKSFPRGSEISSDSKFILLSPLNSFLKSHSLKILLIHLWFYLLFALSEVCCACSVFTIFSLILSGFGFLQVLIFAPSRLTAHLLLLVRVLWPTNPLL